jgi:hypothetical protein
VYYNKENNGNKIMEQNFENTLMISDLIGTGGME